MNSPLSIKSAEELVELALKDVDAANHRYVAALKILASAKLEAARNEGHPWLGMQVYRIMGGGPIRTRAEHGIVCFKDFETPDYGNAHIMPGTYYVLVDGKSAHMLNKDWELDLL